MTILSDLMMKDDAPASARISAARTILDYAIRAAQIDELRARIDALEEFIRTKQLENLLDEAAEEE